MERVLTTALAAHAGQRVRLAGWVHHQRRLANVTFLLLRDGRGIAQVVVEDPSLREQVAELESETVVAVDGLAVASPQAPGGVEVHDPVIDVIARPDGPRPFELRRREINAQLPKILDHAALSLRHPHRRAAFSIAAASVAGFRSTLDGLGFTEIYTPKVVESATEGGANVFAVDWFGRKAYLAQSPQLYKQTMVGVFERVYEVGPVFRAEPHDTARHLAEYVSLDVEFGFITDHRDVMRVLERTLRGMLDAVTTRAAVECDLLNIAMPQLPACIPSVDFLEAQTMIEKATGNSVVGEPDLSPSDERWLGAWAAREHGSDFVFVTGFPLAKRPFYTAPDPERAGVSNSFDLIFRGTELVSGGQRLHRYAEYVAALDGLDLDAFAGYFDAFRYGMPPHGGFAIGLERWVARLVGAANVREVTLFPRDIHRLAP